MDTMGGGSNPSDSCSKEPHQLQSSVMKEGAGAEESQSL